MGKSLLRKFTAGFVIVAFLLQVASIAAPGWLIAVAGNIEAGSSLFYMTECYVLGDSSKCSTESFRDSFNTKREGLVRARVSRETIAEVDFFYHMLVCKQALTMFAASLSFLATMVQVAMFVRRKKNNVRLTVLSAVLAAVSAGLVLAVVSFEIVNNAYRLDLQSMDDLRDHSYIGFPYCIAMLAGSAMLLLFSDLSTASLLFTPKTGPKKTSFSDDFDTPVSADYTKATNTVDSTPVDAPASKPHRTYITIPTIPTVTKPKDTTESESAGQDNPVFSEKL